MTGERAAIRCAVLALGLLLAPSRAAAAGPVAVIVELRLGSGEIEVRRAGEAVWRPAQPLLSLRAGDQISVTGEGRLALAFRGERGARVVTAADSPFTVEARQTRTGGDLAGWVATGVVDFLLGLRREGESVPIAVRPVPPIRMAIVSPRDGRLLPGPVVFEWTGYRSLRYRVRVTGPEGILWDADDLPRGQVAYPAGAPRFRPGVRYYWQVEAPDVPDQKAYFEILGAEQADQVRHDLDSMAAGGAGGGAGSGAAVLKAGYLTQLGLFTDARQELAQAIIAEPGEPTLHYLLGVLYERWGLATMAGQEFIEARDLSGRRP